MVHCCVLYHYYVIVSYVGDIMRIRVCVLCLMSCMSCMKISFVDNKYV